MSERQLSWDTWEAEALKAGVSEELAQLGREVLRDHVQHGYDMVPEPGVWRMGDHPQYMLKLAQEAPNTAFYEMTAIKVWNGASGLDGDVEAYTLLIDRLGSEDAADQVLSRERATRDRLFSESVGIGCIEKGGR